MTILRQGQGADIRPFTFPPLRYAAMSRAELVERLVALEARNAELLAARPVDADWEDK